MIHQIKIGPLVFIPKDKIIRGEHDPDLMSTEIKVHRVVDMGSGSVTSPKSKKKYVPRTKAFKTEAEWM